MSQRFTIVATLLLVGAIAFQAEAQTKVPPRRGSIQPKARVVSQGETMKDGFLMKDGKLLQTINAHTESLSQESALVNGTKVQPDGNVTMADGSSVRLQEGDYMSPTGRLTTRAMKAEQDSLQQVQMMKLKKKKK